MGKDHSDKKIKKEKKEKKEKRAEENGVVKVKKEKKEKKSKTVDSDVKVTKALEAELERAASPEVSLVRLDDDGDVSMQDNKPALGSLVPFANPLADDPKEIKKILRTVRKSAKTKTLRRGVKEVVKALRKSEAATPSAANMADPPAVCIIAADISPMDVISHIPVLCEDHLIPYIYIRSRAELGEASATKRPTSVVMIARERVSKKVKDIKDSDVKEFQDAYGDLVKLVIKASRTVRK
ncbi:L30e-like protein [Lindgomyces ingoldianus]|uniref:L30e-like protein n=1 Tax=Lindgomyces ingoldianus TaxID=673940 RepID=A0ACB6QRP2_9PLEO|nr:L30e-like protein [Lindgomyces ingoldianus]KAF2468770.1 L30e-like protein [Lindgomyces ingoldianus]